MKRAKIRWGALILIAGCSGSDGENGSSSLTNVSSESAGDNCQSGGVRIDVGVDDNGDGTLDDDEIDQTKYVCNGAPAEPDGGGAQHASLVSVNDEPAGSNCAKGGLKVQTGEDTDDDGTLSESEVADTHYVCNGAVVTVDGGVVSPSTLVSVTSEAAGANCAAGGVKIVTGVDGNANGMLDGSEEQTPQYACNGDVGAAFGSAPAVKSFSTDPVSADTATVTTVTVQSASITVPTSGIIVALASADVFCSTTGGASVGVYDCPATGNVRAYYTIAQRGVGSGQANGGDYSLVQVTRDTSENLNVSQVFGVAAGTYTVDALGAGATSSPGNQAGHVGFFRSSLTLVFVPID